MSDAKDPAIKLFGKTIPFSPAALSTLNLNPDLDEPTNADETHKDTVGGKPAEAKPEDDPQPLCLEELTNLDATSGTSENPKTPSVDKEAALAKNSKSEEEQSETSASQEKTLKKPDKILPCPRCNSMDTKFCYYNNYNVNQPRHFCKNCQRYWTAGGTMRNVPVGAGRRKNKNSASQYRHIAVSEALQHACADGANGVHNQSLRTNGTVLTFGSDSPLCESMASALNLAEKTMRSSQQNGFHKPEEIKIPIAYAGQENGDGSSVAASSKDEADKSEQTVQLEQVAQNCQSFPPQVACFPAGAPWPYPWSPVQWSSPVPPPAFCPPGFPMPFYPASPYWGCAVPGPWNIPLLPQPLPSPNSGPNSPTLGKHSREESTAKQSNSTEDELCKENNSERCLWIPKTLRIDDPGEAAKSSIWATLGIKSDKADSISGGRLFKAFQSKANDKNHGMETSPVLQANPAALSRSLNFQESS